MRVYDAGACAAHDASAWRRAWRRACHTRMRVACTRTLTQPNARHARQMLRLFRTWASCVSLIVPRRGQLQREIFGLSPPSEWGFSPRPSPWGPRQGVLPRGRRRTHPPSHPQVKCGCAQYGGNLKRRAYRHALNARYGRDVDVVDSRQQGSHLTQSDLICATCRCCECGC